jgi:hypothetical protein
MDGLCLETWKISLRAMMHGHSETSYNYVGDNYIEMVMVMAGADGKDRLKDL